MKPGELERLSMAFDRKMRELEDEIMTDIIRRIRTNGEITRSADWQINRLYELGMAKEDIEKAIKKHLHLSSDEIKELFEEAAKADYVRNAEIYRKAGKRLVPFEENEALRQLVSSVAEQTGSEMQNLSGSLGFAVKGANGKVSFKPAAKYYQDALDKAVTGIATGAFDYNTAIKKAVAELVKSGLRSVDYSSGLSSRVNVAARRAVMAGYSQIVGKINEQNAAELETDTFEVTWHGGARPTHQVWQGKWYTKKELVTVCGLGTVTGLHGANCYHDYYPVIPGVSEPTYTADELREMNAKENVPTEYCGKTYTKYEALQRQRSLETRMRAQRRQIKLLQEGNAAEDDIINARCRYRGTSGEYSRFSKAMGIPQQRERVTVDGLGNIGVGKYAKTVEKSAESGIINSDIASASLRFVSKRDRLYENAKNVLPLDGFEDVICHSDATGFAFVDPETGNTISDTSAHELASLIRSSGKYKEGTPVRLLSCQAGAKDDGIAQKLADELNTTILAPTETLFITPDGEMFITDSREARLKHKSTGVWKSFKPRR